MRLVQTTWCTHWAHNTARCTPPFRTQVIFSRVEGLPVARVACLPTLNSHRVTCMFPPPQDDAEFAQRAKQTRSRWALAKAYSPKKSSSKSEAARALKKHARIALGDEAVWPPTAVIKVGAASVVPTICIISASLVMFPLCARSTTSGARQRPPLHLAGGAASGWSCQ